MTYSNLRKGLHSQPGQVYHITTVTQQRIPYFAVFDNGRKVTCIDSVAG